MPPPTILPAQTEADIAAVATLFRAYAASLDIDLAYQDFAAELAALPGKYAPPAGALLLARDPAGHAIGCAALRPLSPDVCEMKRLYVDPAGRGTGLGQALAEAVIATARRVPYREMRLDTLPSMHGAQALYRRLGFVPTAPYYAATPGTLFMRLDLGA